MTTAKIGEQELRTPSPAAVRRLAAGLHGELLRPGDRGYEDARHVFNAMIDRHPALIVRCRGAEDVARGVTFARTHGLPISVKAGGHGIAGKAVCDAGLVLDLSGMRGAKVDPAQRVATVQAGLTLGDLDRATEAHGLAAPTGIVSVTGLAGLALGGGLGWLNGKHGLTCDNVLSAEVVTAAGELVTASAGGHPDLLWGLRGGGGNFGAVTSFTLQLHPVTQVLAGGLTFPASRARAALRRYHEVAATCPDELTTAASLSRTPAGEVVVGIAVCHTGPAEQIERLLEPLRALGPDSDSVQPMAFRAWQQAQDGGYPPGQQHYWKSAWLTELGDDAIEVLVEFVSRTPSGNSGVGLQRLHGAAGRVDPGATAYPHRGNRYDCLILSQWPDPAESEPNVAWTQELFAALEPHFATGVYVNNLGNEGEGRVRQAYGPNYDRLAALKRVYDPTNLFHHNQNIRPAPEVT